MKYAASKKKAAIVFEVKQGMVDRGADVAWLSQYPHEKEITFQVTDRHSATAKITSITAANLRLTSSAPLHFQPLSAICVEGTRASKATPW